MITATATKSRPLPGSMRPADWDPSYFGYDGSPRSWIVPAGEGTIELPESPAWSPLCRELIVRASCFALGGIDGVVPIERWGGVVPYIDRGDLFCAAADLDDGIPAAEVFAGLLDAMAFIGIEEGGSR